MSDDCPKVSVLMPVRNGEAMLAEAIDSILQQTMSSLELIVIDDGSTDSTPDIIQSFERRDPRVRSCKADGKGISAALNKGLSIAKASLIARMDADDISLPHRFEKQVEYFDKDPQLVLLGSYCIEFSTDPDRESRKEIPSTNSALQTAIRYAPNFFHPSIMVRADALKEVGGYRSSFDGAEDHDLYLRLSRKGSLAAVPDVLFRYRLHPGQVTQSKRWRSHMCSAAAVQSNLVKKGTITGPLAQMASDLLQSMKNGDFELNNNSLKLAVRTINALTQTEVSPQEIRARRNALVTQLVKQMRFLPAFKLWRKTRKV